MTRPTVFIASGCDRGTTTLYRCVHLQEQFAFNGIEAVVREWYDRKSVRPDEALDYDIIVLHRVAMSQPVQHLIKQAQARGKPVIFDTDDLVFEPEMTQWHRGVARLSPAEQELYHDGVRRYLATMEACDYVLTSTPVLAELARRRGKTTFVLRNTLGRELTEVTTRLYHERQNRPSQEHIIIGYSSGTPTHDVDFEEVVPALLEVMTRHPQVELWTIGPLLLPEALTNTFSHRIRRFPLMDWRAGLQVASHFDINLAPLERGNIFCRAKSEVKFIEIGAMGIATIASRIDPFEYAITPGEDGLLAGNTEEWIAALDMLITDPARRRELGEAARRTIEKRYTIEARARELSSITKHIFAGRQRVLSAAKPSPRRVSVPLTINWVIVEPFRGSGGHTDIFRIVRYLSRFGHEQNVYVVPAQAFAGMSDREMAATIAQDFFDIEAEVRCWTGQVQDADVTIATHWSTAYLVNELTNGGLKCYFVQDFEPYFHPMGTMYLKAEHTYRLPFLFITLGKWLAEVCRRYGGEADYFDLAVDRDVFYPRPVERQSDRLSIAFYARPSTPRRCFELGVEALRKVWERHPDVDIFLFGADTLPHRIPFPHTNLGILDQESLAQLFSGVDVGLVLSSTNCSLIPLEMMACKCAVVDLKMEPVEAVLTHEENALLADPTPEAVAETILRLLEDGELRRRIAEKGYAHAQTLSWEKSARKVESILLQRVPRDQRLRARVPRRRERPQVQLQRPQLTIHENQAVENALRQALQDLYQMRHRWDHRLFAVLRNLARKLIGGWRVEIQGRQMKLLGELVEGHSVGQEFVAQQDNLCRIDLLMATYLRTNTQDIIFHLKESPDADEDLALIRVNGSRIQHDRYHSFSFPPLADSRQRSYYFYLESPGSIQGDAVSVWAFMDGERIENGRPAKGQLVFAPFYQTRFGLEHGEHPVPDSGWVVRWPWWARTRIRKGLALLRRGEIRTLIREVRRYLRWRGWL